MYANTLAHVPVQVKVVISVVRLGLEGDAESVQQTKGAAMIDINQPMMQKIRYKF